MKKNIVILLLLFVMPALVHSVTEEGVTIAKLSMKPVPFNERRDPVADSPFNAFDGDVKTAALYSDFTIEFSKPVNLDQIKIMNGNAISKDLFKKNNRLRDIEITLYAAAIKSEKKTEVKKKKKTIPKKTDDKKESEKEKSTDLKDKKEKSKSENSGNKSTPDEKKTDKDKKLEDKKLEDKKLEEKKDNIQPDKTDKNLKEKEIKKIETPEKVVNKDHQNFIEEYEQENVKLFLTANETVVETGKKKEPAEIEKKDSTDKKNEKIKKAPVEKKITEKKKIVKQKTTKKKKPETKLPAKKTLPKEDSKKSKESATTEKGSGKNIIEIVESKKDKKTATVPKEKVNAEPKPAEEKKEAESADLKKEPAGDEKKIEILPDKPLEKLSIPDIEIIKKKKQEPVKKEKSKEDLKKSSAVKNEKKSPGKTKIEIIESKDKSKTEKKETKEEIKTKKEKTIPEKDKEKDKKVIKKEKVIESKKEIKKEDNKKNTELKSEENVTVKKMEGIVKIDDGKDGRVLVYASLKDSMDFQSIDLKREYAVTKISFRTRDDDLYKGSEPDRTVITEIALHNKGKRLAINGIDALKKTYLERFNKSLADSISGETFIMNENNDEVLRMTFKKDGRMEFFDRFKCSRKGGPDCTSVSMPDMWRVTDGKLLMRYHTLWRVWKYELDTSDDMLGEVDNRSDSSRWMKIYFNSDKGFTDKYLDLVKSDSSIWAD